MEEFPSGQRGQTVNLLLYASVVRIHPLPPATMTLHPVRASTSAWTLLFMLTLVVTSYFLSNFTGESPEPVRVSHFVEREFFMSIRELFLILEAQNIFLCFIFANLRQNIASCDKILDFIRWMM